MLHCPTCGKQYSSEVQVCPIDEAVLQADATVGGDVVIDPLLGQTLDDKYRLEARLGIGGMGTVYRARHVLIDRAVAVKVLNPRYGEDEAARERFRREAKAAGRLQHANAVSVTDFGETSAGFVYIVMELLEGRTLRETIAREAPLETARSVSIMLQASAAVAAAHDAGIIHRDLKPANIFVVQRTDVPVLVKVLDFGIAKLAVDSFEEDDPQALTQIGVMIGTPRYMSPEQCSGLPLTPAADVYSLGVILYEMLTGVAPFSGSSPLAIALKHASDLPRRPREIVSVIPEQLEQVVLRALEKRPQDRPADANAFRQELLDTAELLGLEHFAVSSNPDLRVLRDVATQSPSGRLVIDISRLRETRFLTSGANELTIIREPAAVEQPDGSALKNGSPAARQTFPRVDIPLPDRKNSGHKGLLALLGVLGLLLVIGVVLMVSTRSARSPAVPIIDATPVRSPEVQPSPIPSATVAPSVSPKRELTRVKPSNENSNENSNSNKNANKKKEKISFFGRIKRIFKR